jgi:hypothetical protein
MLLPVLVDTELDLSTALFFSVVISSVSVGLRCFQSILGRSVHFLFDSTEI